MNHMTQSSHGFVSYSLCLSNKKIAIVDGTLVTVVGQGNVVINHNFIFKNVLHVPKLSTNLVSIHNLTNDLNYMMAFSSTLCKFHNKAWEQWLDLLGKEMGSTFFDKPIGQNNTKDPIMMSTFWVFSFK